MSLIQGFLAKFYPSKFQNYPIQFTKDNINEQVYFAHRDSNWTVLECVIQFDSDYTDIVREILELGGTITQLSVLKAHPQYYKLLLEFGLDANYLVHDKPKTCLLQQALNEYAKFEDMSCLIDYGAKIPNRWERIINAPLLRQVEKYALLSNHRASSCRQALLALIRVCKHSRLRPAQRPLWGLRGVILEIAKQVWRMRGGEGCGARAHNWG
jgi:hypothetical protein